MSLPGKSIVYSLFLSVFIICIFQGFPSAWCQTGKIVYVGDDGEIHLMNDDGTGLTNLTQHPAIDGMPAISNDGQKIAFFSQRAGGRWELFTMSIDGSNVQQLTSGLGANFEGPLGIDWSPDGTRIIFCVKQNPDFDSVGGIYRLYRVNADGSDLTQLVDTDFNGTTLDVVWAKYSLDGQRIYMQRNIPFNGNTTEIYKSDPDGSGMTRLTFTSNGSSSGFTNRYPSEVIVDGIPKIAFTHDRGSPTYRQIYLMDTDGSNQINISNTSFVDFFPIGSSNSPNTLAFLRRANSITDHIWLMKTDGSWFSQLNFVASSRLDWWAGAPIEPPPVSCEMPIAFWKAEGNANDSNGTNHGILQGNTTFATGIVGQAFSFDGQDDWIEMPTGITNSPPYTVCAWVKTPLVEIDGLTDYVVANGGETFRSHGFSIWQDRSGYYPESRWVFGAKNSSGLGNGASAPSTSTDWTFLSGSWDGSHNSNSIKLYIDGQLAATATPISGLRHGAGRPMLIGAPTDWLAFGQRGQTYDGLIDEVQVFNCVLSPEEIQTKYDEVINPNQPPIAVAGAYGPFDCSTADGKEITLDGTGSSDTDGDPLTYFWTADPPVSFDDATSPTPTATFPIGETTVTLVVNDGTIDSEPSVTTIAVNSNPPVLGAIMAPLDPVAVNTEISASATFTDPEATNTHTALWDWGDNATSAGDADEIDGLILGTHTYTAAGVYTVGLTVTDACGLSDEADPLKFVVVYDPDAGFVTGGGWIDSPPGAYTPDDDTDPDLTGKANFGFVSKYKKGASTPTGQTQFQFKVADLNFHSSAYDWLVIAGAKAQYKGVGIINGNGNFGFILTAIDGQINGGGGEDKFRMKIWDRDNSDFLIYDNKAGAEDDADPTTLLGGGSIKIHKTSNNKAIVDQQIVAQENEAEVPTEYALFQNYPNPFNPSTEINFQLPEASDVTLRIYDVQGKVIRILASRKFQAGYYSLTWDGQDGAGVQAPSGLYLYELKAGTFSKVMKMSLLK